jgi:hypothetical protein
MTAAPVAVVYAITPATMGVAGGPAQISGPSGLAATLGVTFGPFAAVAWAVYDDTLVYVTAPTQNPGTVPVTVTLSTGDPITIPGGLQYLAPAVTVDWPTLPEVRAFLRKPSSDTADDAMIDTARTAAIDYGNRRTNYRWVPGASARWVTPMPDAVHEAALIHAAQLYRRRDSIDGTVGWVDIGISHLGSVDPDVERLYAAVGPLVFA